jgi:hypothetical protein
MVENATHAEAICPSAELLRESTDILKYLKSYPLKPAPTRIWQPVPIRTGQPHTLDSSMPDC